MHQIAQINVAEMKGVNIDDPIMKEFVDNLDEVNALAENSPGFVWRLKDDTDNATSFNPYNDERVIINVSVWEGIESLETFIYKTMHSSFVRRRKEWFHHFGKAHYALWWILASDYPTIEQCTERLEYLQKNGPTDRAFTFKKHFPAPHKS